MKGTLSVLTFVSMLIILLLSWVEQAPTVAGSGLLLLAIAQPVPRQYCLCKKNGQIRRLAHFLTKLICSLSLVLFTVRAYYTRSTEAQQANRCYPQTSWRSCEQMSRSLPRFTFLLTSRWLTIQNRPSQHRSHRPGHRAIRTADRRHRRDRCHCYLFGQD